MIKISKKFLSWLKSWGERPRRTATNFWGERPRVQGRDNNAEGIVFRKVCYNQKHFSGG